MQPDVCLPIQGVVNGEQTLGTYEPEAVLLNEVLEAVFGVSLKIGRNLVFGLKKRTITKCPPGLRTRISSRAPRPDL